jgi:site-specific DNA-cytosine methylase
MQAVKPRLLDLFCGAGGAAVGYHRAGFEVVGVGIDWMSASELNQAIPPAYSEFIGHQLLQHLQSAGVSRAGRTTA